MSGKSAVFCQTKPEKTMDKPSFFMYRFNIRDGFIRVDSARQIVKLEDSTSVTARAVRRSILHGESAHVQLDLLARLRIHVIGIFYAEVGPEWSSCGKQESDYLHHIDLTLTGHRQVVFRGEVLDMEPVVAFWLPGNTPLERRYCEPGKVLFFKLRCEWLAGVDPLLDWKGRRPGPIAQFGSNYWRPWWHSKHKPTFNKLVQAQARILDWIAGAVPNLDEVILQHVQTHSQFNSVFDLIERKLAPNLRIEELARAYGTTFYAFSMAFARRTGKICQTGHGACRATCSAVLRRSQFSGPQRLCAQSTIASTSKHRAVSTIASAGRPSRTTISMSEFSPMSLAHSRNCRSES